eukprot:3918435-Rhodomonas_salina.1
MPATNAAYGATRRLVVRALLGVSNATREAFEAGTISCTGLRTSYAVSGTHVGPVLTKLS